MLKILKCFGLVFLFFCNSKVHGIQKPSLKSLQEFSLLKNQYKDKNMKKEENSDYL